MYATQRPSRFETEGMSALEADTIKQYNTPAGIAELSSQVGGCPRDIIRLLQGKINYKETVQRAVNQLNDLHALERFITDPSSSGDLSHCLVLVQKRDLDRKPDNMADDGQLLTIKGTLASERLWTRLLRLKVDEARALFQSCSTATSPYCAALSDYVFKNIALRLISSLSPSIDSLSLELFAPMVQSQGREGFPRHFAHLPLGETQPTLPRSQTSSLPHSPSGLPVMRRKIKRYERLDDSVIATPGICYVPAALNNPLFDAFFYEVLCDDSGRASKVVLWIIRTTISKSCDGAAEGFEVVKTLMEKATIVYDSVSVEVKYVLVTPRSVYAEREQWNMAKEYDGVPGEVYVQFIGVRAGL